MEQSLCEAAIRGSVESLHRIIEQDELILHRVVAGCFNGKSPLHVAVSRGHTQFVEELLHLNPEMAEVLDSEPCSALHLATAKGHVDISNALIKAHPEMCLVPDGDGRNPLHIAAIQGRIEILKDLVRCCPEVARARTNKDETILHLCVKHNQLESLELLIVSFRERKFVNAKDNDGNTILHLAVLDKRLEMMMHVISSYRLYVNEKNASGHTAMDICLQGRTLDTDVELDCKIEDFLQGVCAKRGKDILQGDWETKKRDALMVVSSLIATMAFQAGMNPPGGVWQDKSDEHSAGKAVIAYNYPDSYPYFIYLNTIRFMLSLSTILLLIINLPSTSRTFVWVRAVITWLTVMTIAFTYTFSIIVISPKKYRKSQVILPAVIVWSIVMSLFLLRHTIRLIANFVEEQRSRFKAILRILDLK